MAYLTATRYGLTKVEPTESQRAAGWRQLWRHPSGALAMRHPSTGYWMVSYDDGRTIPGDSWSSSLRAAARKIERWADAQST
jgi:hypothetical protein